MNSLVEKEVIEDSRAYVEKLNEGLEYKVSPEQSRTVTSTSKKQVERHHAWKERTCKDMPGHVDNPKQVDENGNTIRPKYLSYHTHYSPTDPDAKISTKPGKPRQFKYAGQIVVDDTHYVITAACASDAGTKDSENLPEILAQAQQNFEQLGLAIEEITADAGYSSGRALKYCEENNIDAYIPNHGQYKSGREGFIYYKEKDQYECVEAGGNRAILTYKEIKTDSKGYEKKTYRSSESDCGKCPLRVQRCGTKTKFKKIDDNTVLYTTKLIHPTRYFLLFIFELFTNPGGLCNRHTGFALVGGQCE